MKKILLTAAVLLPSLLALSQEASDPGSKYAEVLLVARAEYASSEEDHLGNSSFYAVLDGAFNSKLSYSAEAHLLSSCPRDLYEATWHSDTGNWLDWAYLSYDFGGITLSAGKQAQFIATWENEEYDFDQYYELASWYWNNFNVYQWGLKLDWTPSDVFTMGFSWLTSPYGERPFSSGLYNYTLSWRTTPCDWYNDLMAISLVQTGDGEVLPMWNKGFKFMAGDKWDFIWDSITHLQKGLAGQNFLSVNWRPTDFWSLQARGGITNGLWEESPVTWLAGFRAEMNPLENLRIHALAAYDSMVESPLFNIGLTWKITL